MNELTCRKAARRQRTRGWVVHAITDGELVLRPWWAMHVAPSGASFSEQCPSSSCKHSVGEQWGVGSSPVGLPFLCFPIAVLGRAHAMAVALGR